MLARRRQALETLTISALDLFASSLGVFVLMAILLFPFYLREPSVEAELLGAQAERSAAGRSLTEAEREAADTERRSAERLSPRARDDQEHDARHEHCDRGDEGHPHAAVRSWMTGGRPRRYPVTGA